MKHIIIITLLLCGASICSFAQQTNSSRSMSVEGLFNSNWRNEKTGDWQLSLYNDKAIYDCKVWSYESKTDKKIVLTNGKKKVAITIGKDNNGKRDFTIDDKKMLLSQITTQTLPDYPTADSTAFSTELKNGQATIIGIFRNIPEEYSFGKIYVKAYVADYIGAFWKENVVEVDKDGMFKLTINTFGVNTVHLQTENGNNVINKVGMILDAGNTYFYLCDFSSHQQLFMGEDARLQNEFLNRWDVIDYPLAQPETRNSTQMTEYFQENTKWYEEASVQLKQNITEHPTISKRFRDYIRVANRYAICNLNMNIFTGSTTGKLPDIIDEWIQENGYLDPTMPLTLTENLGQYQTVRIYYEAKKIAQKYHLKAEDVLARVLNGQLRMSSEDIELLKKWIAHSKEIEELKEMDDPSERRTMRDIIDNKYPMKDIIKFWQRPDIDSIINNGAPTRYQMQKMAIDSLYKDKKTHDFALSLWLMRSMRRETEGLPIELFRYIEEVKDTVLRDKIGERQELYASLSEQESTEVEVCIQPASNVEGLNDGKAILEKILEPYKGKLVQIDFWGTWCGGCINQMQFMPMLKSELKDYNMVYLYFANRSNEKLWKQMIHQFNIYDEHCVHYNLPKEQEQLLESYLNVHAYPTYILVDKQGNIHPMGNAVLGDIPAYKRRIDELNKK